MWWTGDSPSERPDAPGQRCSGRTLLIEGGSPIGRALAHWLRDEGFALQVVAELELLDDVVSRFRPDLVVLAGEVEDSQAACCLSRIQRVEPGLSLVVLARQPRLEQAVFCIRGGAFDYRELTLAEIPGLRSSLRNGVAATRELRRVRRWTQGGSDDFRLELSLEAYERAAIERALDAGHGDASRAADLLGIGRSTLYRKLARHGLRATGKLARRSEPHSGGLGGSQGIG